MINLYNFLKHVVRERQTHSIAVPLECGDGVDLLLPVGFEELSLDGDSLAGTGPAPPNI